MKPASQSKKRPTTGVTGIKTFITAAALAGTIGGWALFAGNDSSATANVAATGAVAAAPTAQAVPGLNLPPIPTLVARPEQSPAAPVAQSGQVPAAPTARPSNPAPVAARPAPITRTRSSR